MSPTTTTTEKAERVAADQAAMAAARAAVAAANAGGGPLHAEVVEDAGSGFATSDEEVPMREEPSGQLAIGGPGTQPKFSTDAGGRPAEEAEIAIGSYRDGWEYDMPRGTDLLFLVHAQVVDVLQSDKKRFISKVVSLVEFDAKGMDPRSALMAVHDLQSREMYVRAAIDQAAAAAQDVLDNEAPESGVDLAALVRERMYDRFKIADDAREATFGISVGEEPAPEDDPEWDAAVPEVSAAEREAALERQIDEAVAADNTGLEEELREELAAHRHAQDPDLTWEEAS